MSVNDITGSIFLLLRLEDMTPGVFICPSSNDETDTLYGNTVTSKVNFTASKNVSYGFAVAYPSPTAIAAGYRWSNTLDPTFAVAGIKVLAL